MSIQDRVKACFKGLSCGDAIGKQTEMLSRDDVRRWYPNGIRGFEGTPGDVIPRYAGRRYEWRIGETTDDTEQTIAVARAIARDRSVLHRAIGEELLKCRKSLHPGVSLWTFHQIGDPARIATEGDGCGAAMRVAPVGVMFPSTRLEAMLDAVYASCVPTHGGQLAISAAAAVAFAISAALDGLKSDEVFERAVDAAQKAERFRLSTRPIAIAAALRSIRHDLSDANHLNADYLARFHFPDKPETIVPLAISIATATVSARDTILLASNTGGDTDSVASIGGAIAAAMNPDTLDPSWSDVVESVNGSDLFGFVGPLTELRGLSPDPIEAP